MENWMILVCDSLVMFITWPGQLAAPGPSQQWVVWSPHQAMYYPQFLRTQSCLILYSRCVNYAARPTCDDRQCGQEAWIGPRFRNFTTFMCKFARFRYYVTQKMTLSCLELAQNITTSISSKTTERHEGN